MTDSADDRNTSTCSYPPEPPALPILGRTLLYARNPLGFVECTVAEYGPVVSFTMPGRNGVLLADSDAIEHVLARNADNYENPEAFRPRRWKTDDLPDYGYFPFGGGPRVCIGRRFALLEARLVLARLLRVFRFEAVTVNLDLAASMTLTPTDPVQIRLSRGHVGTRENDRVSR